jgi:hypothetical protein
MHPVNYGYLTRVNLYAGTTSTSGAICPASWQKTYAGDFDDVSDHSRSGHRTD